MTTKSCALHAFNECKGKITAEHYISQSVMRCLGEKTIKVVGLPWVGAEAKSISIKSMAAKCLCEHHNSTLTEKDEIAGQFFRTLQEAHDIHLRPTLKSASNTFNGHVLEKWFLKVAFMMLYSENFSKGGEKIIAEVPKAWGDILLGKTKMPDTWGLYVKPPNEAFVTTSREFGVASLSGNDNVVRAVNFVLASFPFTIVLGDPDSLSDWGFRRPSKIVLRRERESRTLNLRWDDQTDHVPIIYDRIGSLPPKK